MWKISLLEERHQADNILCYAIKVSLVYRSCQNYVVVFFLTFVVDFSSFEAPFRTLKPKKI